jgi:HK97 family phage prohead protease
MPETPEYKSFVTVTKEIDDRTVTGLTATMGNIDAYNDIIFKGAFKKTIAEQAGRIRHLWQHDSYMPPIAAIKQIREVGKGEIPQAIKDKYPDAKGALEVTREYLNTPRADEVFEGIRTGAISEMSIGYSPVKWDYDENEDGVVIRNLREVRLWDTSDVNWGANAATAAVKSALDFQIVKLESLAHIIIKDLNEPKEEDLHEYIKNRVGDVSIPDLISNLITLSDLLAAEPTPLESLTHDYISRIAIATRELELSKLE